MFCTMTRNPRAGLTLLEVIIVAAVMLSLVLIAGGMIISTTREVSIHIAAEEARSEADRVLDRLAGELSGARVVGTSADGSWITYQVPVDLDNSGTVLDANGDVEWGSIGPAGVPVPGGTMLRFTAIDALNEGALNLDVNGDNDKWDDFVVGRIERVYPDASVVPEAGRYIIQTSVLGGDVDDDAMVDPIFVLDGTRVRVHVLCQRFEGSSLSFLGSARTEVQLRNPQ